MLSVRSLAKSVAATIGSLAVACATTTAALRASPEEIAGDEIRGLVAEAHALERELERLGLVARGDPALGSYLQSVGERVAVHAVRSGGVRPRFAVLYDPSANAIALPNGAVYVHTGLLARLENEAQLAQVLAHELSHVFRRHRKDAGEPAARRAGRSFGEGSGFFFDSSITASLGAAGAAMSAGFDRREPHRAIEREREADLDAFRAMTKAGYRPTEAVRLYALLAEDGRGADGRLTHPTFGERSRALGSAAGEAAGEALRADTYRRATREIVVRNVRLCLEQNLYRQALEETARSRRLRGDDPRLDALEAEARRHLADDAFEGALRRAPRHEGPSRPHAGWPGPPNGTS